jgi:hypothetical protein
LDELLQIYTAGSEARRKLKEVQKFSEPRMGRYPLGTFPIKEKKD